MIYLWILGTLAAVVLGVWVTLVATASKRITGSLGQPTPDEAKIEADTALRARELVNQGDREKSEVMNADRDGLLARFRDRVRGK